jgi:hypothetical protein
MAERSNYDYASLKELLKNTNAEVLLPTDGEEYEKSIRSWSEHCVKRAVSRFLHFIITMFASYLPCSGRHDYANLGGWHVSSHVGYRYLIECTLSDRELPLQLYSLTIV